MSTFFNISNRCILPHSIYMIVTILRINCNSYPKLFLEILLYIIHGLRSFWSRTWNFTCHV